MANNPSNTLLVQQVETVAKDILENNQIGTASKRVIQEWGQPAIKNSMFFNDSSAKMRDGNTNKLLLTPIGGWGETNVNNDLDFLGIEGIGFLSENLYRKKSLSTKVTWNTRQIKNTEAGVEKLKDLIVASLTKALPIEMNKRILNTLADGFENGIDWYNDSGQTANFKPTVHTADFSTTEKTQLLIDQMADEIFGIQRLENAQHYLDNPEYYFVIAPELDWAIQKIGAYVVVGGDKTFESFLGNRPIKIMANNVRVVVCNEVPKSMPIMLLHDKAYYTGMPETIFSNSGYSAVSPTQMFLSMETDYFGIQMPYWYNKFGNIVAWKNANFGSANAYFGANHIASTGVGSIEYSINAITGDTADNYQIFVVDNFGNSMTVAGKVPTTPTLVDGTVVTIDTVELAQGTYAIEIRYDATADGATVWTDTTGELVYRTSNYRWANKTTPISEQVTVVNSDSGETQLVQATATPKSTKK